MSAATCAADLNASSIPKYVELSKKKRKGLAIGKNRYD